MRELKFRVWDKEEGGYLEGEEAKAFVLKLDGTHYAELTFGYYDKGKDWVIEQYTGLKDKNGKEIYEGDIVRIDSMDELRVGYVDLVNDQYCIVCGEDDEGYKILAEFYYYSKPEENCEVIGNIHENQDLLGDTNVTNRRKNKCES